MLLHQNFTEPCGFAAAFNVLRIVQPRPLVGSFVGRLVVLQAVLGKSLWSASCDQMRDIHWKVGYIAQNLDLKYRPTTYESLKNIMTNIHCNGALTYGAMSRTLNTSTAKRTEAGVLEPKNNSLSQLATYQHISGEIICQKSALTSNSRAPKGSRTLQL